MNDLQIVAPVRERGLKSATNARNRNLGSRSRKGAWIEIATVGLMIIDSIVAPVRERGLKY